jgi:hypothetical protein
METLIRIARRPSKLPAGLTSNYLSTGDTRADTEQGREDVVSRPTFPRTPGSGAMPGEATASNRDGAKRTRSYD